jgi:hypothetical protein
VLYADAGFGQVEHACLTQAGFSFFILVLNVYEQTKSTQAGQAAEKVE